MIELSSEIAELYSPSKLSTLELEQNFLRCWFYWPTTCQSLGLLGLVRTDFEAIGYFDIAQVISNFDLSSYRGLPWFEDEVLAAILYGALHHYNFEMQQEMRISMDLRALLPALYRQYAEEILRRAPERK